MKMVWISLQLVLMIFVSFEALGQMNTARTPSSESQNSMHTCRYITGDVGTIIGTGKTKNEAFADAADKCFDRRVRLYEQVRQTRVDIERGQDFIDSCVNLQCS